MGTPKRIAIVAAEPSGDLLAAGLIQTLKKIDNNLIFEGIGGPKMAKAGCHLHYSIDQLSVMGLIEPLVKLPKILKLHKNILDYFIKRYKPDLFIAIDAPDFNLNLEKNLKKHNILTVHYISPTIWAWRYKRIYKIKKSTDLVLCLWPFEPMIYKKIDINAKYIGHPLADQLDLAIFSKNNSRKKLKLNNHKIILALLPGSRTQELKKLAKLFLAVAINCQKLIPNLEIIIPTVNIHHQDLLLNYINSIYNNKNNNNLSRPKIFLENSHDVIAAADSVLTASGTATLEILLLKKPMVVAYKTSWLNYHLAKLLINKNLKFIALPNLIANKNLVPEFLQYQATIENLTQAVLSRFEQEPEFFTEKFDKIARALKQDSHYLAAQEISKILNNKYKKIDIKKYDDPS